MKIEIDKIILFGSTGMLGRYIYKYFTQNTKFKIISIDYRVNKESLNRLENLLIEYNINDKTCVINCIGLIPQRKNDKPDSEYFLVNSIFPQILSIICNKYNSKMIQPTTDCVFNGKRENGNYIENDIHDETNLYGMSKSLGEPSDCTIIRTSIIGREIYNKKSFMEWVISNSTNNIDDIKVIDGWDNHYWNGITCLEYCKILQKIIDENLFWKGVRHIYSPSSKSKYQLACIIKDIFNLNLQINKMDSNEIINKSLSSNYKNIFNIKEIYNQIKDLKEFDIK